MRMIPDRSLEEALATVSPQAKGYIMPRGAALLPISEDIVSDDSRLPSSPAEE